MMVMNCSQLLLFHVLNISIGDQTHCRLNRPLLRSVCLCLFGMGIFFFTSLAVADKIHLKDGSVEESNRVWESDNYVHFILKGTQSVEIRYAKEIVERIEHTDETHPVRTGEKANATPISPKKPHNEAPEATTKDDVTPLSQSIKVTVTARKTKVNIDNKIVQRNRNVAFYNPRREKRYWSDRNSGHTTLSNAIESIARYYGKTPVWVEQYMGQENDLGIIHSNLIAAIEREQISETDIDTEVSHSPKKGLSEVDVDNINSSAENHAKVKVESLTRDTRVFPSIPHDILFYDPRRPKKYWASLTSHHNTMDDAVRALADFYGIPAGWVEDHLGNTNQLYKIHENIQSSLSDSE